MDSMAPIARADTARTEASDTSPPVTGSDGRGLGVVASAGAGGVSGFSGSHGFSDSHGGNTRTRSQASSYRLDAGETRSSPSNRQTNTYHPGRSAVRYIGAPCASNAPAPILNVLLILRESPRWPGNRWLSSSVGTSPPDGLYASSLEGLSGIAGPPYAHRRIRPIRRELILFVAGILAMIRRESRYGNGVAELGTDIRRMLSDRRHDF